MARTAGRADVGRAVGMAGGGPAGGAAGVWLALSMLVVVGCQGEGQSSAALEARCRAIIERMAECYPDLATEARCDEQTVAQFESLELAEASCDQVGEMGKADAFGLMQCAPGQHVCGWIFCCDNYHITWFPSKPEHWNIIPVVDRLRADLPSDVATRFARASRTDLRAGISTYYLQDVAEEVGGQAVPLAVEYTQQLVQASYAKLSRALPAERWGVKLDHYLGGEVRVYQRDAAKRAIRQLERMVLSPFPCDFESPLSNNDMTKVEIIEHGSDRALVRWRVMYSDNNSTVTDVGSVEFRKYDAATTLITFHSAHRLNLPGGIPIPLPILGPALSSTFLDFTRHYRQIVESAR